MQKSINAFRYPISGLTCYLDTVSELNLQWAFTCDVVHRSISNRLSVGKLGTAVAISGQLKGFGMIPNPL